ncbi:Multicopper oxidase, type 1 [Corchorus olitorius]|uniref:Laccase n=1 Tax=Corchorus olitorius TaxID=93759 RepID=A0A1R3KJU0_9ROSI|nr:Multicopper oxidase, type 1 [Corchorus olitorius]
MLVVNDSYPGPEIRVHRGDAVYVNVHNQGTHGFTIHWHGVKQYRNPWSDGPEFVTQCPIQPGTNFTYQVILTDEIGTLWWHAHSDWSRGSIHGAFIILPAENETYPFPTPDADQTIILESWYNRDFLEILTTANSTGRAPPSADAYAISGHLGDTYGCANDTIFRMKVDYQKAYLLRIINGAMNEQMFFTITNHSLTVVAQDASYVQKFTSDYILITPGQTMDVLVFANQNIGQYYMAMRPFSGGALQATDNITTGILQYTNSDVGGLNSSTITLPVMNDANAAYNFTARIKNSNVTQNPALHVPKDIDRRVYIAIATNTVPCIESTCESPEERSLASMNNVSFVFPYPIDIPSILRQDRSINGTVYTEDFPLNPPEFYNFTGELVGFPRGTSRGTKAVVLNFGEAVENVLQATELGAAGGHPIHLHGFSFYWVGTGIGNFSNLTDPLSYNLVDPPLINTIQVPRRGWVALRFFAQNTGVWFMHCHYERHSSLGMDTVFIVKNGTTVETSILPPPASGMPCCPGT